MKRIKNLFQNWISYLLLAVILMAAFYIRIYRIDDLLGFYYDQGRDALVIWKLWHDGKLFLIGPVTGLAGVFLGPYYYFLIAPLYLIGGGNPVYPSVFLSFLSVSALLLIFKMGSEMHSRVAGLIAAAIGGFSYYIVYNSRWLSNPNPMFLLSLLFFYSLWKIVSGGKKVWWVISAFIGGLSLNFESASAFFYLFLFSIFVIWQLLVYIDFSEFKQSIMNLKIGLLKQKKWAILSFLAFIVTILPQIIFNFKHDNILL